MASKPKTIDQYLSGVSTEQRATLEKLRRAIRAAAPKAEECISYGIPAFRLGGRLLVGFGRGANHCSFYPGAFPIAKHKKELKRYSTSKGTIRYSTESPLPAALVRKLVQSRIAEYEMRYGPGTAPVAARRGGTNSMRDSRRGLP